MRIDPGVRRSGPRIATLLLALAAQTSAAPLAAQTASWEPAPARSHEFPLTIESIMRGPELVGQAPSGIRWSDDGEWVYFRWLPGGEAWHEDERLYRVPATGGEPELVEDEDEIALSPILGGGDLSPDGALRVVSSDGDLYLISRDDMAVRRLTNTEASEGQPAFSADGRSIFFRRDQDAYALSLDDGSVRQLTRIETGPAEPEEPEAEGHKGFLERQQEELFEHIRTQKLEEERREARTELRDAAEPETVHLEQGERAFAVEPDPNGRFVAITAGMQGDAQETDIPRWITESGYTENTEMRSKVGDEEGASRIGIIQVATGTVAWIDLSGAPADGAGEAEDDEGAESGSGSAPGLAVANFVGWDDTGTYGLAFAVDEDFETWRLYAVEAATGDLTLLDTLADEAWVGGPCFSNFGGGCMGWYPSDAAVASDGPRAWYVSEETGWAHLYAIDADGSDRTQLTSGEWEVEDAEIPDGADHFLLHTSEVSPFDRHPWRMEFDGSGRVQMLEGEGFFDATPSPDGERLAVVVSRANHPPELFLGPNGGGLDLDDLEQVTTSPTAEWMSFPWIRPEIVRFEARDGTMVPARIYRPADLGAEPSGAGVVFVHGAGYLHNVHHAWSSYYREYMFHHFLAASGYTVLDVDYRGSAGYGRDWRTAIYRHMGGRDLTDQVDGATYLVEEEGVDADRLGIYGGSYGGFITLMALFTHPGVFEAGAALRSVTDWAHYNHWYTSRILNLPHEDEEAYRQSSPIYFAEGLEDHLLILHGMYDTNVHFSDVVRLVQRLIELGKENWDLAVYPVENHSFVEPASWTDEYRRIFELFERVIGNEAAAAEQAGGE